ncbi:MAG: NAD(P)/FAD-dependent oxidoreductase [Chitinivibrionales bacterium]|nr:NAD(P)/FAD-dependent oxidoreductase [Chitinivibrionales bacterium]
MTFDIVIVGASISGLYAGLKLARQGLRVCIIDRRSKIGLPVQCGEATGNRKELARFVEVDESWIARDVTGLTLHVNEELVISRQVPDAGVVLHRDRFEQTLAQKAQAAGAQIKLLRTVTELKKDGEKITGIILDNSEAIEGRYIIGADGAESRVGQWTGIVKPLALHDAASAIQYRIQSTFCNDGNLHFFVGSQIIPQGYIWVFPKSADTISVGAVIYGCPKTAKKASHYLDNFININLPNAARNCLITGSIPLSVCPRNLAFENVLIIGDAARQVNPLTAGGIMNSLEASDLAVKTLLASLKTGRTLAKYSRGWSRTQRRQQKAFGLFKEVFLGLSDHELADLAKKAQRAFRVNVDRSQPFILPIWPVLMLLWFCFPKVFKHRRILWQ